jgi:hypothetical protein
MSVRTPDSDFREPDIDWRALFIIAALSSVASIIVTGALMGVRNHVYILPIVNALYDEPQFANDAFIESLRHFASGPWILLSGVAKYVDVYWLFLCLNFLSRFLAFAGFLACGTVLGIRSGRALAIFAALLCATSLLRGQSLAGDGGLFINYFTHSEIANGLTLILLFLLMRGWLLTVLVVNGLVFFTNAFIGVWDAAMIAAITATMAFKGDIAWRQVLVKGSLGTLLAVVVASPVIRNILINPDFGKSFNFDFVAFLEEFWPYHFIFSDIPASEKLDLASVIALGIVAFAALGRRSQLFIVAIGAFSAVYVVGIAVPHLTHSALILNLHLLRVSTMLQLLAVLGALAIATRWSLSDDPQDKFLYAPLLILILCTPIRMTSIQPALNCTAALLIVASYLIPGVRSRLPEWTFSGRLKLNYVAPVLVTVGFIALIAKHTISDAQTNAWFDEWSAVGGWAKANTSAGSVFIIPTWNFRESPSDVQSGSDEDNAILTSGIFASTAHRSVWIDFRNGAAVLWSPSYYAQWHQRVTEINSLPTIVARLAYAKANGISYVIDVCQTDPSLPKVFSTRRLCVYSSGLATTHALLKSGTTAPG